MCSFNISQNNLHVRTFFESVPVANHSASTEATPVCGRMSHVFWWADLHVCLWYSANSHPLATGRQWTLYQASWTDITMKRTLVKNNQWDAFPNRRQLLPSSTGRGLGGSVSWIVIRMCPCDDVGYAVTDDSVSDSSVTRLVLVMSKITHRWKCITTSKIEISSAFNIT